MAMTFAPLSAAARKAEQPEKLSPMTSTSHSAVSAMSPSAMGSGAVRQLVAAVLEAGLIGGYLWDSSRFEGLFPQIISQLSLFARFYTIVNGVFDVTAIVYYLSVTGFFLFLSVQSLEKRRWSE